MRLSRENLSVQPKGASGEPTLQRAFFCCYFEIQIFVFFQNIAQKFKKSAQAVLIENSNVFDRKKDKKLFQQLQGTANKSSSPYRPCFALRHRNEEGRWDRARTPCPAGWLARERWHFLLRPSWAPSPSHFTFVGFLILKQ